MPYFKQKTSAGGTKNNGNYGGWDQDHIIDGSGVYITRNQGYTGTFKLQSNTAYDNGINGLVVHKSGDATVYVQDNIIFDNGRTKVEAEGR